MNLNELRELVLPPYTPQQNGITERKNMTLIEMVNSMLIASGSLKTLWGGALLTICYILNGVLHSKTNKTPFEIWEGRKPSLRYFKVWGCLAYIRIVDPTRPKLGPHSWESVSIGYAQDSAAYRFIKLEDLSLIESGDADFFEDFFPFKTKFTSEPSSPKRVLGTPEEEEAQPKRSKRLRTATSFGPDFETYLVEEDPSTFQEAMTAHDTAFWKEALDDEIESILANNTWELTDLPLSTKL